MVELETMAIVEAEQLLNLWLEDVNRTLQHDQRNEILTKFFRLFDANYQVRENRINEVINSFRGQRTTLSEEDIIKRHYFELGFN